MRSCSSARHRLTHAAQHESFPTVSLHHRLPADEGLRLTTHRNSPTTGPRPRPPPRAHLPPATALQIYIHPPFPPFHSPLRSTPLYQPSPSTSLLGTRRAVPPTTTTLPNPLDHSQAGAVAVNSFAGLAMSDKDPPPFGCMCTLPHDHMRSQTDPCLPRHLQ